MKAYPGKNKRKLYLIILVIIFSIILLLIWRFNLFSIKKLNIEISNADCVKEQNIVDDASLIGKNIFFFDSNSITNKSLSKYPCIKKVEWERQFPDKLKVNIIGRSSFLRISTYKNSAKLSVDILEATPSSSSAFLDWSLPNIADKEFLADETGFIFKESKEAQLPILFLQERTLKVADQLNNDLFNKLVIILEKFNSSGLIKQDTVNQLKFKLVDNALLITLDQKVVLSLSKDIFRQLASLQLILQKAKIDGRTMDSIDLRFDKPIIMYSEKKK